MHRDDSAAQADLASLDFVRGVMFLIDKPQAWTSFDVVAKIRGALRRRTGIRSIKVGHSGTLDPMATGLLILCTGAWTKKLQTLQGMDKEYSGVCTLGAVTASYDAETPPVKHGPFAHLTDAEIRNATRTLTGAIDQMPPVYSAIKVKGQPAYHAARAGKEITLEPRSITVHTFTISRVVLPEVHFSVSCSKGTYVRSLIHDLGQRLGCGAYLTALRRTAIGPYRIEDAWPLDALVKALNALDNNS